MLYRSTKKQVVEALQVTQPVDIPTPGGFVHADAGDWLIVDPEGNLNRCDNVNFQCSYETVVDSDRYAKVDEGTPCGS